MILVIGLAGRIGAGKGAAAEYLKKKYKAQQFVYSDILGDVLKRLHLPVTREELQKLGSCLREGLGADVLVDAMEGDLKAAKAELRLIDGLRYVNEVEMLRRFPHNKLIFLDAPLQLRYERSKARNQKGEGTMTLSQFKTREKAATERELDAVKRQADIAIDNSGTLQELHAKIDRLMGRGGA
jgi:dephospho-CoA kinase